MDHFSPEDAMRAAGGSVEHFRPDMGDGPYSGSTPKMEVRDAGLENYSAVPPRAWLLGTIFCRRFLSSLLADGGVGKTALRVAQLVSMAIGRSLTGEYVFHRCRVLIVSLEDDWDELRRRILAVLKYHGISPDELRGWLFLSSPKGLRLAEMREGAPAISTLEIELREAIETHNIDLVSLDPFVKSHGLNENDNASIDFVCTLLTKLAIEKDCAVDVPHHTRKGGSTPGDANNGRGASAMNGAARLVYTLTQMTSDEAEQFGVEEGERRRLIRMDSGKVNITPNAREAAWFKLVGVSLENGTELYPNGDEVQTVVPWSPPDTWKDVDQILINRILDEIDAGMPGGILYSNHGKADDRAAWRVVNTHLPEKPEKQAKAIIKTWIEKGVLYSEKYMDPEQRKERVGLRVNHAKRPGTYAP